jgi:hypothetical protein
MLAPLSFFVFANGYFQRRTGLRYLLFLWQELKIEKKRIKMAMLHTVLLSEDILHMRPLNTLKNNIKIDYYTYKYKSNMCQV